MRILPIASGSGGNCYYVNLNGHALLFDMGVRLKKLKAVLGFYDLGLETIEAAFITHTHYDHTVGFPVFAKHLHCPIFASKTTRDRLANKAVKGLAFMESYEISPELKVTLFKTSHDCPGSCGFVVESGLEKLTLATDLGFIPAELSELATQSKLIIIEANHDRQMLAAGPYPPLLKLRIASDYGHLSNDDCAAFVREQYALGCRNFLLAHLSETNNTMEKALAPYSEALKKDALIKALKPFDDQFILID